MNTRFLILCVAFLFSFFVAVLAQIAVHSCSQMDNHKECLKHDLPETCAWCTATNKCVDWDCGTNITTADCTGEAIPSSNCDGQQDTDGIPFLIAILSIVLCMCLFVGILRFCGHCNKQRFYQTLQ